MLNQVWHLEDIQKVQVQLHRFLTSALEASSLIVMQTKSVLQVTYRSCCCWVEIRSVSMAFCASVYFKLMTYVYECSKIYPYFTKMILVFSARNGLVYANITYRNFFLFLNFIPSLNIYYIHLYFFHYSNGISLFRFQKVYWHF
jgi:hypothetical protein